jgi:hypothetical protein
MPNSVQHILSVLLLMRSGHHPHQFAVHASSPPLAVFCPAGLSSLKSS